MIHRLVQHSLKFLVFSLALAIQATQAQTFSVIHRFKGSPTDGAMPMASLIADSAGNLYGTTQYGGAYGYGTAFRLSPSLKLTVLHSFCPAPTCTGDGTEPVGGLLQMRPATFTAQQWTGRALRATELSSGCHARAQGSGTKRSCLTSRISAHTGLGEP